MEDGSWQSQISSRLVLPNQNLEDGFHDPEYVDVQFNVVPSNYFWLMDVPG